MHRRGMWMGRGIATWLLLALAASGAGATDWNEWGEYRYNSALPGMLFGVTPEGEVGFAGALQQNIPVAFTPAAGQFVAAMNSASNNQSLKLRFWGDDVDGTAFLGVGSGESGRGLYGSCMIVGHLGELSWNLQYSPWTDPAQGLGVAVGCLDVFNMRESRVGDPHSGRSVYVSATAAVPATARRLYLTAGVGSGRYENGFGGASWLLADHWRLLSEYDGLSLNAGVAWGLQGASGGGGLDWTGYLGWTNLERPTFGITATYRR